MFDVGKPLIDEKSINTHINSNNQNIHKDNNPQQSGEIVGLGQKSNDKLIITYSIILLVIFVGFSAALYIFKLNKTASYNLKEEEASRLNQQLNSPELKEVNTQAEVITIGLDQFTLQYNARPSFKNLMEQTNKLTPKSIKLVDYSVDEKFAVKIDGQALTDNDVADFLNTLSNSNLYKDVTLTSSSHTQNTTTNAEGASVSAGEVVDFSIDGTVQEKNLLAKSGQ